MNQDRHPPPNSKAEGGFNDSTICDLCGSSFKRNRNLQDHMEVIHGYGFEKDGLSENDFEPFIWKQHGTAEFIGLRRLALQLSCHERYILCWSGKYAFNNLYPFLFPTGGQRLINFDDYGNSKEATEDLNIVLKEAHRRDCPFVLLHKRIKIVEEATGKTLFYLRENITLPEIGNKLFDWVDCDDDVNLVKISLKVIPEQFPEEPSLAAREDLQVYQDFKRGKIRIYDNVNNFFNQLQSFYSRRQI